jgi:hypothetical protein
VPQAVAPASVAEKPATRPREVEPVKKKGKKSANDNTGN